MEDRTLFLSSQESELIVTAAARWGEEVRCALRTSSILQLDIHRGVQPHDLYSHSRAILERLSSIATALSPMVGGNINLRDAKALRAFIERDIEVAKILEGRDAMERRAAAYADVRSKIEDFIKQV